MHIDIRIDQKLDSLAKEILNILVYADVTSISKGTLKKKWKLELRIGHIDYPNLWSEIKKIHIYLEDIIKVVFKLYSASYVITDSTQVIV